MRTSHEPQFADSANQNSEATARGVRKLKPRLGRPKPYPVQWAEKIWDPSTKKERRKVSTEFYPTEALRDKRYASLVKDKNSGSLTQATRQEITEWRAFQGATEGAPWQQVVAGWRSWLQHQGIDVRSHTVEAAVNSYLARYDKLTVNGQRALATQKKVDRHLRRFCAQFGHLRLEAVKTDQISDWIDDLDDVESDATFNTYRRDLHAFFAFFVSRGELARNPASLVPLRDELSETVGVLSIEHTAKLLHTAQHYHDVRHGHRFRVILPRIVLETLAGLRHSSALRLTKSDINFSDHGITLPKRKLKTKKRHYLSGFPDMLWPWLALAEERAWEPIEAREYRFLKSELFAVAEVPHPPNCLRHGFASYVLAATKNPGIVAYLLAHKNQDQLWDHYNGRVTEADGKRFMKLSPSAAARLAPLAPKVVASTPNAEPQLPA